MNLSNKHPLVSVIIPGYNHAAYLRERIESVLAQTFTDYEVIMLDDCSPDDSASIMRSYEGHEKVSHVVINEQNSGNTFVQWERGIRLAQGKYIWIAESDDVAKPTFLAELVAKLEGDSEVVLAFSRSRMIGPDSEDLGYSWDVTKLYHSDGVYDGFEFCLERLVLKDLLYNASMIVWRKDVFDALDDGYKHFRHCGDWWFWFEVCMRGKVVEVPQVLNGFRQHPNKVSNDAIRTGEDFKEMGAIQKHILERIGASGWQRSVVRGRMTKRIRKLATVEAQKYLVSAFPEVFAGSMLDLVCYNIDKLLHISGFRA